VTPKLIGERPTGATTEDALIVRTISARLLASLRTKPATPVATIPSGISASTTL